MNPHDIHQQKTPARPPVYLRLTPTNTTTLEEDMARRADINRREFLHEDCNVYFCSQATRPGDGDSDRYERGKFNICMDGNVISYVLASWRDADYQFIRLGDFDRLISAMVEFRNWMYFAICHNEAVDARKAREKEARRLLSCMEPPAQTEAQTEPQTETQTEAPGEDSRVGGDDVAKWHQEVGKVMVDLIREARRSASAQRSVGRSLGDDDDAE